MNFSIKRDLSIPVGREFVRHNESRLSTLKPDTTEEITWKGHLRARWFNNKGSLYWDAGIDTIHDDYAIKDWDELSTKYFKALDMLKEKGTLRNSYLFKNGDVMHKWSDLKAID